MKTTLNILAQSYENYSDNPSNPSWKAKGPVTFTMEVDFDTYAFDQENVEMLVNQIIEGDMSNDHVNYEVRNIEAIVGGAINITEEFDIKHEDLMAEFENNKAQCGIGSDNVSQNI